MNYKPNTLLEAASLKTLVRVKKLDEGFKGTRSKSVKKAMNIIREDFDADEMEELLFELAQKFHDDGDEWDNKDFHDLGKLVDKAALRWQKRSGN